jgi:hypothetical protein
MKTSKEEKTVDKKLEKKDEPWCPYCEDDVATARLPFCQPCQVKTFKCPSCGKPAARTKRICPECGAKMKPGAA